MQAALEDEKFVAGRERVDTDLLHRKADVPSDLPRAGRDVESDDRRAAGRWPYERPEDADRRRLPRAVRAKDAVHLARADTERDPSYGLGAVRVALGESVDDDGVGSAGRGRGDAHQLVERRLVGRLASVLQQSCGHVF